MLIALMKEQINTYQIKIEICQLYALKKCLENNSTLMNEIAFVIT